MSPTSITLCPFLDEAWRETKQVVEPISCFTDTNLPPYQSRVVVVRTWNTITIKCSDRAQDELQRMFNIFHICSIFKSTSFTWSSHAIQLWTGFGGNLFYTIYKTTIILYAFSLWQRGGSVAEWFGRRTWNPKVAGASPVVTTNWSYFTVLPSSTPRLRL